MPTQPRTRSSPSPIQAYLDALHRRFADLDTGAVANYIPELTKANPAWFGIAVATVDGQVYEVGDTRQVFTIQSVSKPFAYGVALEDRGRDKVLQRIGVEPSGDAFNSISLEPGSGRPLNPMINAGAIATAALICGDSPAQRLERLVGALSAYAGRTLDIDSAVFESERTTGHRNRAIGHMLRNYDIMTEDPEQALELYFQQCSVQVDCRDLAMMAATLANAGRNPVTRQRAVQSEFIDSILSVMTTCGMYDFTGEWVYRIGLPAKSGVGGGIIAVLPGQLGIGVFSPLLDERGNSARGVKVCEAMSVDLGLHFLKPPRIASTTMRAQYTLAKVRSKRRRMAEEATLLEAKGHQALVYELQGDLHFSTIEPVLRHIVAEGEDCRYIVLDFMRVQHADHAATHMIAGLVARCASLGQHLVLTRVRRGQLLASLDAELDPHHASAMSYQPQLDLGIEWCERGLLLHHADSSTAGATGISTLEEHRLCEGAAAEDIAHLNRMVEQLQFDPGSMIVNRGDAADALYFLMRGQVSVVVDMIHGGQKRLSTLSPGMGFGETALTPGSLRSADVRADTAVECWSLSSANFTRLELERPSLAILLLHNLLKISAETAARLTNEVAAMES